MSEKTDTTVVELVDGTPLAAFCNTCGLSVRTDEEHVCTDYLAATRRAYDDIERRRLESEAAEEARRQARPVWRKVWDAIWDRRDGIVMTLCGVLFFVCFMGLALTASAYEQQASGASVAACSEVATRHYGLFGAVNVAAFPECEALSATQRQAVQSAFIALSEAAR